MSDGRERLFSDVPKQRDYSLPAGAYEAAERAKGLEMLESCVSPAVDGRVLEVYERATNPTDPIELRDLWLGRVECELGRHGHRPELAAVWRESKVMRRVHDAEVLGSRATVRLVKELFNWFFRDDLYGELRDDRHLILSSGSVDEEAWGLPGALKDCIHYAIDRDWYGYSDSRGRDPARDAIAAYESARMDGVAYQRQNVAITMGGTFATSTLVDFILLTARAKKEPALCGIPNYPPLVESVARRGDVQLVPLPSERGHTSLEPLVRALRPETPLVLLQTVANPTGATVTDQELSKLVQAASPSTMILLDECHEWLGPVERYHAVRARTNVVRIFSISKGWSAPGLKVGWILADSSFIDDYYEYASSTFGGPPSVFYTSVEVLTRMERWLIEGLESPGVSQLQEFEPSYGLTLDSLQKAYASYRSERIAREDALTTLRDATHGEPSGRRCGCCGSTVFNQHGFGHAWLAGFLSLLSRYSA